MVKQKTRSSTLISLAIHLGIVASLLVFSKPISVLIPSRSDGIEVSLVSMPNQTVQPYTPPVKVVAPAAIKTVDTPADINVKQNNTKQIPKPTPPAAPPKVEPKLTKTVTHDNTEAPTPTTSKTKTHNKKVAVNDLLGDVLSTSTTSVRKGKALGGNPNGTSDSNNLVSNYADLVIRAVRPYVTNPDDLSPNAKVVVRVEINPDLSVRKVTLEKASGNAIYDQNVQSAIMRLRVFPPLPDGSNFVDYRILHLTFRP